MALFTSSECGGTCGVLGRGLSCASPGKAWPDRARAGVVPSDACGLPDLLDPRHVGRRSGTGRRLTWAIGWTRRWVHAVAGGQVGRVVPRAARWPGVRLAECGPVRRFTVEHAGSGHRPGLAMVGSTGRLHGFESLAEQRLRAGAGLPRGERAARAADDAAVLHHGMAGRPSTSRTSWRWRRPAPCWSDVRPAGTDRRPGPGEVRRVGGGGAVGRVGLRGGHVAGGGPGAGDAGRAVGAAAPAVWTRWASRASSWPQWPAARCRSADLVAQADLIPGGRPGARDSPALAPAAGRGPCPAAGRRVGRLAGRAAGRRG